MVIVGLSGLLLGHLLWLYQCCVSLTGKAASIQKVFPDAGRPKLQRVRQYNHFYVDASITVILFFLNMFNWLY
jgi:hypothetical protein